MWFLRLTVKMIDEETYKIHCLIKHNPHVLKIVPAHEYDKDSPVLVLGHYQTLVSGQASYYYNRVCHVIIPMAFFTDLWCESTRFARAHQPSYEIADKWQETQWFPTVTGVHGNANVTIHIKDYVVFGVQKNRKRSDKSGWESVKASCVIYRN